MQKYILSTAFVLAVTFCCAASGQDRPVRSDDALAYLNVDIESTPGWIAKVKGGYQWKLFRNVGLEVYDTANGTFIDKKNHTKDGATGSVSLGYNFGRHFPLTLGLQFGVGPSGKLSQGRTWDTGLNTITLRSYQKISIYTLDLTADYDFRNRSCWTPFIGVTAGAAFVRQSGNASVTDTSNPNPYFSDSLDRHRTVNFMTGGRAGVKYDLTERLTLSLYGSYNYLGTVKPRRYTLTNTVNDTIQARTRKVTVHSVDAKIGLRYSF